jgi:heptosyltransferase III
MLKRVLPRLVKDFLRCAQRLLDEPSAAPHVKAAVASFAAWRSQIRRARRQQPRNKIVALSLVEHMGDIVEAEPIARYLRQRFPDATIYWFVRAPYAELVESVPYIDVCAAVPCITTWILLRDSNLFDEVFDLHINFRPCLVCRLPLSKTSAGKDVTLANFYDYGSLLWSQCACAGIPPLDASPSLHIPAEVEARVARLRLPKRYLAFHARSNEVEKDWPYGNWEGLLTHVVARWRLPIVEVGLTTVLQDAPAALRIDLCGVLSILETAAVLRAATFFVGVDSGPAHFANAAGVPGLVLLGQWRNFQNYMPFAGLYSRTRADSLLRAAGPVHDLPLAQVIAAVDRRLCSVAEPERSPRLT